MQTLFFSQIDDPTVVFVIGAWESKDAHQHGFDGSPQQAEIINLIKDQLGIEWMHYMDVEQSKIPINAPVLAIIKATLPKGTSKVAFDQEFASRTRTLGGGRYGAISAWNIFKNHKEDTVRTNFSGWESIEEATEAFVNTIESSQHFRVTPEELNFFFMEKVDLD